MAVSDEGLVTEVVEQVTPPESVVPPVQDAPAITPARLIEAALGDDTATTILPAPPSELAAEKLVSSAALPQPTAVELRATPTPTDRRVARLAAIEAEIRWLGDASLTWPMRAVAAWQKLTLGGQAPFAVIKRKTGRFRLPRHLKAQLIDQFCSTDADALKSFTTLIIVAHPDDESIGAGARLRHLGDSYVVDV